MTVNTSLQFVPEVDTARLEKLAHPSMTCTWVSPGEPEKKSCCNLQQPGKFHLRTSGSPHDFKGLQKA